MISSVTITPFSLQALKSLEAMVCFGLMSKCWGYFLQDNHWLISELYARMQALSWLVPALGNNNIISHTLLLSKFAPVKSTDTTKMLVFCMCTCKFCQSSQPNFNILVYSTEFNDIDSYCIVYDFKCVQSF